MKGDIGKSDQDQKEKFRDNYDDIFRKDKEPVYGPSLIRADRERQKMMNTMCSDMAGKMVTNPNPYVDPFPDEIREDIFRKDEEPVQALDPGYGMTADDLAFPRVKYIK